MVAAMHIDAVDLRSFYYRTKLGRVAQTALRAALRELWPDIHGMSLAGYGFAAPFLRPFKAEAARTLCLMPAQQGAFHWPIDGANVSVLVEERNWPINAGFFDRIVVAHGLETSERPGKLLEEINRCLAPGGKAIFIAPNRSGLWARRDATPFGYGRPYSVGQLERQLQEHGFEPERSAAALYALPSHKAFWLRMAPLVEKTGRSFGADRLAGAILVETTKLAFAAPRSGSKVAATAPIGILEGLTRPKPAAGRAARDSGARGPLASGRSDR
ncbi:MAG: methyltransferase domain-containing protein [Rubrimonas sp.]|uniref:methyltransferase domain-containing protein n=1 Tax=Rubrimonas sp. TaxID=2036015 RepID=UPI002FDDF16D